MKNSDKAIFFDRIFKTVALVFFFLVTLHPAADLDLGWHLRYGEYFFETGQVLKDNILSFIWTDYKWVQASWGYDLLSYQIFNIFGFIGISVAAALIAILIFFIVTHPTKRFNSVQILFLMLIFLSQSAPLYGTGLRSQTPSTLFFALALVLLYKTFDKNSLKYAYFLPFIYLIWANMHGGFALGLILSGIFWASYGVLFFVRKKFKKNFQLADFKLWVKAGAVLFASTLAPFINPWGFRVYEETFKHSTNTNLYVITEWRPLTDAVFESVITSIVIIFCLFLSYKKKKISDIPLLVVLLITAYLAFNALRFLMNFGVIGTFFIAQNLGTLKFKWSRFKFFKLTAGAILIALIFIDINITQRYLILPDTRNFIVDWKSYCNYFPSCSEEITEEMLKNPPKGNGYHPYDYGGYLSWRVPGVKSFVDGRMSAWEKDSETPPVVEVDRVVQKGNIILFRQFDSMYNFQWIIVPNNSPMNLFLQEMVKAGSLKEQLVTPHFTYYLKT